MVALKYLKIENFRGFDSLEIDGLSKLNLFVGKNNSGKTSILEALFLLTGMSNPLLSNNINSFRGLTFSSAKQLKYLFHNLSLSNIPSFYARFDDTSERWLNIEARNNQNKIYNGASSASVPEIDGIDLNFATKTRHHQKKSYKSFLTFANSDSVINHQIPADYEENLYATFVSAVVKDGPETLVRFAEIVKRKGGDSILQALKMFDDNIEGIQPLNDGIYFNQKNIAELVPSNIMGDGIRRFLNIVTAATEKQNAFILIDEIENGLHFSAYKWLWKSLLAFSEQNNVQLFITTHNIETLASLKSVLEEPKFENMQDFSKVFNIAKTKNAGFQIYKYSFEGFKDAIEYETEIRN